MTKLLGVVLLAAIFIGGCGTLPSKPTLGQTETHPSNSIAQQPSTSTAPQSIEPSLGSCNQGQRPTKSEMFELLTRTSMYAPLDRLTGPALALEQQWLELQKQGWPPESGRWTSDTWYALDISQSSNDAYILTLQHGSLLTKGRSYTRFKVVCGDSLWKVQQVAMDLEGPWQEPASELPGQRGEMTLALANQLVSVAQGSQGPWFAQVATGAALAWGRQSELYLARAWKAPPMPWRRTTEISDIRLVDEVRAIGQLGSQSIEFRKDDGAWRIHDFTEGGQWVGPPAKEKEQLARPGMVVFSPPFGIMVGFTAIKAVEEGFGSPDAVQANDTGKVYLYRQRGVEVQFDRSGKATAVSMKTGALLSGVRIGSPIELWERVYGPQSESIVLPQEELTCVVQGGRVVEIKTRSR